MAINKNFVVKNGFEVSTDLIFADANTRRVGIASTAPKYTLDVRGGIGATDLYLTGFGTFTNELNVGLSGTTLTVLGGSNLIGVGTASPQYLLDIRSPVSTGQTALYVQGDVRITGDLNVDDIFFDDATVQNLEVTDTLIVGTSGGSGIATIGTLGVSGLTTTKNLQVTGVSTFIGFSTFNNSVNIQGGLNVNGTGVNANTLNITGVSTFTKPVGFSSNVYISGITTFNNEVVFTRGGSVNPVDQVIINDDTEVGPFIKAGNASFYFESPNTIIRNVNGGGRIRMDSPSGIDFEQYGLGGQYRARFDDTNVNLYSSNSLKFQTIGAGVTITGTTFTNQLSSSGVATASAYYVDGTSVINNSRQLQNIASLDATTTSTIEAAIANGPNTFTDITVSGVSTFVGLATFNSGLQVVSGVTTLGVTTATDVTLQQLNVSGITTLGVTTATNLTSQQLNVSGVSTLGTVQISSGIVTATSGIVTYYGDGQYLDLTNNPSTGIGIGTTGGIVGYGITFIDFYGAGVSTSLYDSNVGIATIYFEGGGGGSASIGIGTTPGEAFPGIVTTGNLWYNSNLGRLFIYYADNDSQQWVDASPFNVGIITSLTNVSFSAGTALSPSMYFVGDPQTGFFSPGSGQFTVVSTGSSILNINPSGINVTGVATAQDFDSLSDIRYKENINTVNSALLKVDQLRGVKFNWKETGLPSYGVIAQELEEVLPELVHGEDPKTVNYNGIIGVLIEAIKELKAEIEELKSSK